MSELQLLAHYRLKTGNGYNGRPSGFIGFVSDIRIHDSNSCTMYRLRFFDSHHQAMFGDTYFYEDDLEVVG